MLNDFIEFVFKNGSLNLGWFEVQKRTQGDYQLLEGYRMNLEHQLTQ